VADEFPISEHGSGVNDLNSSASSPSNNNSPTNSEPVRPFDWGQLGMTIDGSVPLPSYEDSPASDAPQFCFTDVNEYGGSPEPRDIESCTSAGFEGWYSAFSGCGPATDHPFTYEPSVCRPPSQVTFIKSPHPVIADYNDVCIH
jgi:hypothetical protein